MQDEHMKLAWSYLLSVVSWSVTAPMSPSPSVLLSLSLSLTSALVLSSFVVWYVLVSRYPPHSRSLSMSLFLKSSLLVRHTSHVLSWSVFMVYSNCIDSSNIILARLVSFDADLIPHMGFSMNVAEPAIGNLT